MSTTAPPRTDIFTEADEALLARLDPDREQACQVPDCGRAAVWRVRCMTSGVAVVQCSAHMWSALTSLTVAARQHLPLTCVHCQQSFCSHLWAKHYEVTPVDGAA